MPEPQVSKPKPSPTDPTDPTNPGNDAEKRELTELAESEGADKKESKLNYYRTARRLSQHLGRTDQQIHDFPPSTVEKRRELLAEIGVDLPTEETDELDADQIQLESLKQKRQRTGQEMQNQIEQREKLGFNTVQEAVAHIIEKNLVEIDIHMPQTEFPYHFRGHTEFVVQNLRSLGKAVQEVSPQAMTDEQIAVLSAIGSAHDGTQEFEIDPNTGNRVRHRGFGSQLVGVAEKDLPEGTQLGNEQQDGRKAAVELQREVYGGLFEGVDEAHVEYIVGATAPEAAMIKLAEHLPPEMVPDYLAGDVETFTMLQPNAWREGATLDEALMALADLGEDYGTTDTKNPDRVVETGTAEFRELMLSVTNGIEAALKTEQGLAAIPPEEREDMAIQMLSWLESQEGFILGQWVNFQMILDKNDALNESEQSAGIKSMLTARLSSFKENADRARAYYEQAAAMLLSPEYVQNYTKIKERERIQKKKTEFETAPEKSVVAESTYFELVADELAQRIELRQLMGGKEWDIDQISVEKFTELCRMMGYYV